MSDELNEARRAAKESKKIVRANSQERKNGWTNEALTSYVTDRVAAQSLRIDINSYSRKVRPMIQNHKYNPHRWRDV